MGKTTTAVNLAIGLSARHRRTLLVDLDPQANAIYAALGPMETGATIYHVLIGRTSIKDAIRPSDHGGMDVLPSDTDLAGAEVDLVWTTSGQALPASSACVSVRHGEQTHLFPPQKPTAAR